MAEYTIKMVKLILDIRGKNPYTHTYAPCGAVAQLVRAVES